MNRTRPGTGYRDAPVKDSRLSSIDELTAYIARGFGRDAIEAITGKVDDGTWEVAIQRSPELVEEPICPIVAYKAMAERETGLATGTIGKDGITSITPDASAAMLGLERHVIMARTRTRRDRCAAAMARVGVSSLWAGLDLVAGDYHFPEGNPSIEALRVLQNLGHVPWHADVRVERSYQAINPGSVFVLRHGMDWFTWQAWARHAIRKSGKLEKSPQWQRRKTVEHLARTTCEDGTTIGGLNPRVHATLDAAFDGNWSAVDVKGTRGAFTWEPRVMPGGTFKATTCHATTLVTNASEKQATKVHAMACALPCATVLEGECTTMVTGGKVTTARALAIDALLPSNDTTVLADIFASLLLSEVQLEPESFTLLVGGIDLPVEFPTSYPRDPAKLFGTRRASAVDGHVLSLAEQWKRQQLLNEKR